MTEEQSAKQVAIIIGEFAETDPAEYLRMVHLMTSMDEAQLDDFLAKCHEALSGGSQKHDTLTA